MISITSVQATDITRARIVVDAAGVIYLPNLCALLYHAQGRRECDVWPLRVEVVQWVWLL